MSTSRLPIYPPCVVPVLFFCTFLFASASASANAGVEFSSQTHCEHADIEHSRSLRVVYRNHSQLLPCRVLYQKDGVEQELASAENTAGFCEKTERQVVRNLVTAGWQCHHQFSAASFIPDATVKSLLAGTGAEAGFYARPETLAEFVSDQFLLVSRALESEEAAHHLAAVITQDYPQLQINIIASGDSALEDFQLLFGSASSTEALEHVKAPLHPVVSRSVRKEIHGLRHSPDQPVLAIVRTTQLPASATVLPDDQPRYRIAHCLAEGHRSSQQLADCTGYRLDLPLIDVCLAGGSCVPEMLSVVSAPQLSESYPAAKFSAADFSADEIVSRARFAMLQRVSECSLATSALAANSVECIARVLLSAEQRFLLDCHEGRQDLTDFVSCSGEEQLSALLDSGRPDQRQAVQCLLAGRDTPLELLDCAGGRLGAVELRKCQTSGFTLQRCFSRPVLLQEIVDGQIWQPVALQPERPRVIDYREQLFESQGGDLQAVLSDIELAGWSGIDSMDTSSSVAKVSYGTSVVRSQSNSGISPKTASGGSGSAGFRRPFERFGIAK